MMRLGARDEGGGDASHSESVDSNLDYCAGCDYAAVEIREELAKLMLRRISVLGEQKDLDPSLYETYYWDSSPEYFSPCVNRASQSGEAQKTSSELEEMLENLEVDTWEIVAALPDFRVPESHIGAVECAQMIVRDGGIAFTAHLRHTDIYVTTAEIPKEVIESALASATA